MLLVQTVPAWKTLREATEAEGALRVLFAPVSQAMVARAWRNWSKALKATELGPEEAVHDAMFAFQQSLLRDGVLDWEGIGDQDGEVLPFSTEVRDAVVAAPDFADLAAPYYVAPVALREMEKNGLALSRPGTSPETTAKAGAHPSEEPATASPAPEVTPAAGSAPTTSTTRKRKKVSSAGV